ncbi:hypothetical protein MOQ_004080 [Trypanosoma cruzi marinkellei]|uniref:Uncharacterized protein n=1 Tax=Trypanosoma cruzi marinkellei TaxID=85056 RepID=K2MYE2_TRYCR|nr:hypothetical protein MOQ_004080 [Trypanosoma cruzi marinkellei]
MEAREGSIRFFGGKRSHDAETVFAGGGECPNSPPMDDFSHVLRAAHINFGHVSPGASSITATGTVREQPSPIVDRITQGLLASSLGCARCAQIDGIRESLKCVEASYLGEIAQLRRIVGQIDGERMDAVNRMEQTLLTFERSRQQSLSKDCEIHSLIGQLQQMEDRSQRLEYELDSLRQLYRREVAFYHQRETFLFLENERCARAALSSLEEGWRSALEARHLSVMEVDGKSHRSYPHQNFTSLTFSYENEGGSSMRGGPSPGLARSLPPSITRQAEKNRNGGGGSKNSDIKGGLLTELWQSKRTLNEVNEKLQRELRAKEDQISTLRQQLSLREVSLVQSSEERAEEDNLKREMQEEIDDMLRTEVFLTQMCERHRLETEAMEGRVHLLQWLQQRHVLFSQERNLMCLKRTPEKQGLTEKVWTPGTIPFSISSNDDVQSDLYVNRSKYSLSCQQQQQHDDDELYAVVSQAVSETLQSVLHHQPLPIKRTAKAICATENEIKNNTNNFAQKMHHDEDDNVINAAGISASYEKFLDDIRRVLQEFCAANPPREIVGLSPLLGALKKVARLTSHNAKVMDDKLNDILILQSAVARQLALLTTPSAGRRVDEPPSSNVSATASLSIVDAGVAGANKKASPFFSRVHSEPLKLDTLPAGKDEGNAPVILQAKPSHEWDVADSDDESIPPIPVFSSLRKTPYDVDEL